MSKVNICDEIGPLFLVDLFMFFFVMGGTDGHLRIWLVGNSYFSSLVFGVGGGLGGGDTVTV